jgi:hypothetical protein
VAWGPSRAIKFFVTRARQNSHPKVSFKFLTLDYILTHRCVVESIYLSDNLTVY